MPQGHPFHGPRERQTRRSAVHARQRRPHATWAVCALLCGAFAGAARADLFHAINAGSPIQNGQILFTNAKAAAIAATGCRAVRINFRLDGHNNWDAGILASYDTIIANALNNNLTVLGLLSNESVAQWQPQFNDDPDGDGFNPYVTAYATIALQLIDRYKTQIKRWEIWNEPNAWTNPNYASDPQNAGGTYILPRIYANLLAESYKQCNHYNGRTILTANGITLCSGGLFAHNLGGGFSTAMDYMQQVYARTSIWNSFQAQTGRRYPWDVFGYHFYLSPGEALSVSELAGYFDDVRAKQAAANDNAPVLVTEFGWNTAGMSENLQRDNLRSAYDLMETRSYILAAHWYQWKDDTDTEKWGLTRLDGSHKPAYAEFVAQNAGGGGGGPPPGFTFSAPTGANLAPASTTVQTDSVFGPGSEGQFAIDGVASAGSKWTSTAAAPPHWLALDLGGSRTITGYVLKLPGGAGELTAYNAKAFRYQNAASLAGPWTDEAIVDNGDQANNITLSYITPKTLRFIRLYITDPGIDNHARIPEFEVWGTVPPPPPVAAFTATPTSGAAPLLVAFTDASTGSITTRTWNFGDGNTSTLTHPSHTYTIGGTYTVSLTVSGAGGSDTQTRTDYITAVEVNPIPADFDRDNDVDADDFLQLANCLTGANGIVSTECADTDLDRDGDVDQADFGRFQRCLSGAGVPAASGCG